MTHIRKQIRDQVYTVVNGLAGIAATYNAQINIITDSALPVVNIIPMEEVIDVISNLSNSTGRVQERTLNLECQIYASTYDSVDAVSLLIEEAIAADITLGGLCSEANVSALSFESNGEAENTIVYSSISFTIRYNVIEKDVTTNI
jgi:hypothetical protein